MEFLHGSWGAITGIGVALLIAAVLMARFAPKRRAHLRNTLFLLALLVVNQLTALAMARLGYDAGSAWISSLFVLLAAFAIINLFSIAVFDLLLPAVGIAAANIVGDVLVGVAYLVAIFLAMRHAQVDFTGLVATSAVVSGVIGLSLTPTLGNILGGVALQLDESVSVGDWIALDGGRQGRVKEIRWRHTVVETRDWDTVIVPNASLLSGNIVILGKRSGAPVQHRMWVNFDVDFRHSPAEVIAAVDDALQSSPISDVAAHPAPHAICMDLAKEGRASVASYAARYWLTDLAVDDPTSSRVRERIYSGLARAGIPLAIPAATVFLSEDDEDHRQRKILRDHTHRAAMLRTLDLFREFNDAELGALAASLRDTPFAKGEVMTAQGRAPHWLYILASGTAEVSLRVEGRGDHHVAELKAPDFFGERGAMTGLPRLTTVVAKTPVECYRLEKSDFQKILATRPELTKRISEVMAHRTTELEAIAENLTDAQKASRLTSNAAHIVEEIRSFFGL